MIPPEVRFHPAAVEEATEARPGMADRLIAHLTTDDRLVAQSTLKAFYPIARGRRVAAHPWFERRVSFTLKGLYKSVSL
jgi:hypothetical protein